MKKIKYNTHQISGWKSILTATLLLFGASSFAQKQWTLQECIDYATKHNISIQQQDIKLKQAEITLNTTKNSRLPNLYGSVGQSFDFGLTQVQESNADGSYSLGYKNTSSSTSTLSLGSSTTLFDGFKTSNQIQASKLDLMSATAGLAKAKNDLALNVTSYFLDVLFKKEILRVYLEQEKLSKSQVERTQQLFEAGKVPESQVYDMKSQYASDQTNTVSADNNLKTSLLTLSQSLNISSPEGFDITLPSLDNIMTDNTASLIPPEDVYKIAVASKPEIKQSEYNLQSSEKSLKIAKAANWPELSLSLGIGTGYYSTLGESFGQQLKNRRSESIALNLSIPIFNRFATRNSIHSARLDIENSRLALESVKQTLFKEIQQAYYNAVAAQAKYISTKKAVDAAQISFNYMEDKYQVGKATVFEYDQSQTKLISSQSDFLQAKYEYIFRAKILDFYNGKEITL